MRILLAFLTVLNFAFALSELPSCEPDKERVSTCYDEASGRIKEPFKFELLKLSEFKGQNVSGWLASEKLDGVRAYWDGQNLRSRKGKILSAPAEFTALMPPFAIDGELYTKRGEFENIQSVVMDKTPDALAWSEIKFHIFDVPDAQGGLLARLENLQKFLDKNPKSSEKIVIIKQTALKDNAQLEKILDEIIAAGGEGVVLREPNAPYERGRSQNALKYKKFNDAECVVVAHKVGQGKFSGLLGSVVCENLSDKKRFKIGSGFSDEQRANPPKIGSVITYKYQNLTAKGLPRFPVFLHVRKD